MRLVSPSLSPSVVCTLEETPWSLFYQTTEKWGNENNSALQESTSHLVHLKTYMALFSQLQRRARTNDDDDDI